jgi:transcriptional regulator with XRE-family HTH domain
MSFKETRDRLMSDPEARQRIEQHLAEDYRAVTLADLRQGIVTQDELARVLGVSQRRVSAIETADDIKVSTLRRYVEHLGMSIDIVVTTQAGEKVMLGAPEHVLRKPHAARTRKKTLTEA